MDATRHPLRYAGAISPAISWRLADGTLPAGRSHPLSLPGSSARQAPPGRTRPAPYGSPALPGGPLPGGPGGSSALHFFPTCSLAVEDPELEDSPDSGCRLCLRLLGPMDTEELSPDNQELPFVFEQVRRSRTHPSPSASPGRARARATLFLGHLAYPVLSAMCCRLRSPDAR